MEARSVLRLSALPRRRNGGYLDDDDEEEQEVSLATTPYVSAPSTPRRVIAPLGEVLAAVPFVWELVPGTPKSGPAGSVDHEMITEAGRGSSSGSESARLSQDSSSNAEFEFSSRLTGGVVEPLAPPCRAAEELFSNGRLVPLRLPPRLQGLKKLQNVSDSSTSRIAASPTKKGALSAFCGLSNNEVSPVFEALHLPRSLSPPRKLYTSSSDSVSWSSFSSTFSERKNGHDSPQDYSPESEVTGVQGRSTLNNPLFSDTASTSGTTSPRIVQSRRERLKRQQDQWNGNPASDIAETVDTAPRPCLSRSHARSRPSMDVQAACSLKENLGRAAFANRLGMLSRCMGMAIPGSP